MPCPLFEPRVKVAKVSASQPRLPLIYEFEGVCHAGKIPVDPEHGFKYCNQGYAKGNCKSFPDGLDLSAVRLTVTCESPHALTVLVVEEENYWPRVWTRIDFLISEQRLDPEINDACRHAQVLHFCLSYLESAKGTKPCRQTDEEPAATGGLGVPVLRELP